MAKAYLGDGVYVDYGDEGIILTTENGVETTNTIYLDADVWSALRRYMRNLMLLTPSADAGGEETSKKR